MFNFKVVYSIMFSYFPSHTSPTHLLGWEMRKS